MIITNTFTSVSIILVQAGCGPPFSIDHAKSDIISATRSPPYPKGTTVTYNCFLGNEQVGNGQYTCDGSNWVGGSITCQPISCPSFPTPKNGRKTNNKLVNHVGDKVIFDCNTGYKKNGPEFYTC